MAIDRKAAVAAYKERKAIPGIYAVRRAASSEVWVGQSPDLRTAGNRIWFSLRQNNSPYRSLQSAWNAHGGEGFVIEELELLDEEDRGYVPEALIKARLAHWRSTLGALAI